MGALVLAARLESDWLHQAAGLLVHPWVAGALVTVGMVCLVWALLHPGTGPPEGLALVSFGLFFGSAWLAGYGGWVNLLLFLAGLGLLMLEVFFLPGTGVAGCLGFAALGAAVVLAFQSLAVGTVAFLFSVIVALGLKIHLIKTLPDHPFFQKLLVLQPSQPPPEPDPLPGDLRLLVGRIGVALGPLRPGGTADFDGQKVDVVTRGAFVEKGGYVEGVEVEGFQLVVRPVVDELPGDL